jgi:hypothetical protein
VDVTFIRLLKISIHLFRCGCGDAGYRGTFVEFVKVRSGEFFDVSERILAKV